MSAHTPGPWMVCASEPFVYALHENPPRNRFFALVQSGGLKNAPLEELEANARLIAAAPDLLTWARWASSRLVKSANESWQADCLRAAIAQAEGKS